jgi:PIN domain nuclease of toxin-antitoxin system
VNLEQLTLRKWFHLLARCSNATHFQTLEDPKTQIFVSAVSVFEMPTKVPIGKLELPKQFHDGLMGIYAAFGFSSLSLKPDHADMAGRLPGAHKDPFARLLAAQAIVEDMTLDRRIADFGARVLW